MRCRVAENELRQTEGSERSRSREIGVSQAPIVLAKTRKPVPGGSSIYGHLTQQEYKCLLSEPVLRITVSQVENQEINYTACRLSILTLSFPIVASFTSNTWVKVK